LIAPNRPDGDDLPSGARYNDRKYYSIERAKEVLGYDPQDNSAEYTFDGEPIEGAGPTN
jgi:NAD+ dependent glucose-6-phosphate dehydrogenase